MTMRAIPDECMEVSICDPEVQTLLIGTGEAVGGYALGCSSSAFHLAPGTYRHRRRPLTRRESAGETTDGAIAWSARLEETLERAAHLRCHSRLGRSMMGQQREQSRSKQSMRQDTSRSNNT